MNQRLRSLIQLLGEAIHESVSESEQISEVVEDIRKQGFDVMLMLEATIGLNQVADEPGAGASVPGAAGEGEADETGAENRNEPFSAQDVNFLRSLRIKIQEEPEDED